MANDIETLLEKAQENHDVATKARDNKCYHASISRFYYSLFQTILYVVKKGNPAFTIDDGKDSHNKTFDEFRLIAMQQGIDNRERLMLSNFQLLKRCRVEADYTIRAFNLNQYNNEFYNTYVSFQAFVNRIKEKVRR